ncbi:MAG: alcohol dehydrogenase [Chloroflexi bacterium HGW-Chloroflexi-6]|nr:MAG: alcohol dehydrogenase [Chloroflexi bacterium HGW-Chloroflexi-6]
MKAVFHKTYGSPEVLTIEEIEKPTPKDDEVLVKIRATSVNPAEWYAMSGLFIGRLGGGLLRPKETRLGTDYAGLVEAVGKDVTQFKAGDEVYGARSGAFAEYVCVRNIVIPKPGNLTFEQAAAVPIAAITALQGLRDYGQLQAGQKVLINGASGGVGTFAVQIAKAMGAEVTAVCSPRNVELIRSLGADRVIDYTKDDFTRSGQRYDLLLDIAGSRTWYEYKRVLTSTANFVIVGGPKFPVIGPLRHIAAIHLAALGASQKIAFFIAKFNREDFYLLNEWFESGKVRPVVEKAYPLAQISEAMRHLGTGHAQGKIVVRVP